MLTGVTTWPDFPRGLKVLLLDGSLPDKETTESLLKEASYEVTTCSTSAEAVSLLKQPNAFHLVLADFTIFSFETGDNLKLLRVLKKSRKALAFLLLSDSECPADLLQGVKLGAAEVIPKPLSPLKARTLWQHTVRKMMVKARPSLDHSVDDSDSNSLEQPRTPPADIGCDVHQSCEACSISDSASDLPDMLAFDLHCEDFHEDFSLDQIVGLPESSMSLTDKPPAPDSFGNPTLDHSPHALCSPSPSPPPSGSNSEGATVPAAQPQPTQGTCGGYAPPAAAASTHAAVEPITAEPKPASQPAPFNMQQASMQQAHLGMQAMAVGGFPMWGMPPMPLMPNMMPGCPPFMMPPFMRPFGPMPMPPMGMPMMPFPMCPMPLGMPPMMYPPPGFQFPFGPQLQPPASAAAAAPACHTASCAQPCWTSPAADAPATGPAEICAVTAPPHQPQQQQEQQQQQQHQESVEQQQHPLVAPQQQPPAEPQQQQQQQQLDLVPQQLQPTSEGQDAAWASFWTDAADSSEPPLGLQLKKSNSLLDLLSQHLFSTEAAC